MDDAHGADGPGPFPSAVTFLFTDIEGSSSLWDRDPAAMRVALELHDELLRAVAGRHGGRIFYSGGDGFGISFPTAAAAVVTAREGQRDLERAAWPDPVSIRVRMGLHTGAVEQRDGNYFGPAVNRAARLSDAGHGGQVLVSSVTAALLNPELDLVELGTFQLRGLEEPERIWWLPVPEAIPGPFPPLRSARAGAVRQAPLPTRLRFEGDAAFVGRQRPIRQLKAAWETARSGGSPVVLVSGEPGVGKTRLVAEVARQVHALGATVLYGRCDPHVGVPHQPFAEALSGLADEMDPETVRSVMAPHGGELGRLVPGLEHLVPGLPAPITGDASGNRHRLFNAVGDALSAVADRTDGVALVIDDFHWSDPSTIALLEHLAASAAPAGVLLAVIYRHTDVPRNDPVEQAVAALRRRSGATVVHLGGLSLAEVEEYVAGAVGHDLGGLTTVVAELYSRTGGNPFFISELMRHLVDTRAASFDGERWTVADLSASGIPQGVRELVRERLRTLPPTTIEVLETAATFGQDFDVRFVAAARGVDVAAALAALDPAEAAGVVQEAEGGRCSFVHLLVRMAIYDDLPTGDRVDAHLAAARAIEAHGGLEQHAPELAYHWGEAAVAGYTGEAVTSAVRAAEAAVLATAHDAAVQHLRAALTHLDQLSSIGGVERNEVQLRLAEVLNMTGRLDEAEVEFVDAAAEARRAGRPDLFARAALGLGGDLPSTPPAHPTAISLVEHALALHPDASPTRALLLCRLAERRHRLDTGSARLRLVDEALAIARAIGDDELLARVMLSRVRALHGPDAMAEMLEISAEVDRIATLLPDDALAVRSAQVRMNAAFVLGDLGSAVQAARITSVLAGRLRQPEYQRLPLMWDAFQAMYEGRFEAGAAVANELTALLGGRHSQTTALVGALLMPQLVFQGQTELAYEMTRDLDVPYRDALLAWFAAETGALDRARHHLEALGSVSSIVADANWSWWQGMVAAATAASLCGDTALLAEVREAITPWVHQHATAGLVSYLGSGHHHLGVAEIGLGNPEVAVGHLERAIATQEALGARPFVALSQVELARALDRRAQPGDAGRAGEVRTAALDTAAELGLASVLIRA